jgi:hypothetical protein
MPRSAPLRKARRNGIRAQPSPGDDAEFSANAEIAACLKKLKTNIPTSCEWRGDCDYGMAESPDRSNVTFKIETHRDRHSTTIRLIGRMRAEHLSELEKQIREGVSKIALDLEELDLVDVEAVRFLGMCETRGVTLLNCSAYIRDWIGKEQD